MPEWTRRKVSATGYGYYREFHLRHKWLEVPVTEPCFWVICSFSARQIMLAALTYPDQEFVCKY